MHALMLMRHAKSDWHAHTSDIDRPLNKRGRADATEMGQYLLEHNIRPDRIVVSPARRTQETIKRLTSDWDISAKSIITDDELYLASHETLLELALAYGDDCSRLMLVAHNPGMDYAVEYLASQSPSLTASGKLMVTAAIAHFSCMDQPAGGFQQGGCELVELLRPREINKAS